MSDNKLSAKQAHGPTHRFVFERSSFEDPRSIGLIRSSYARDGQVLVSPLIVAADHPNAQCVLNEGDTIEVAENDPALLHLVRNSHNHLFRWVRCSVPEIEPEPLPAKKQQHGANQSPKEWFVKAKVKWPQEPGELTIAYADRLHGYMKSDAAAGAVSKMWSESTMRRRLHEATKTEVLSKQE
jgi:hypothetical protein